MVGKEYFLEVKSVVSGTNEVTLMLTIKSLEARKTLFHKAWEFTLHFDRNHLIMIEMGLHEK